MDLGIQGDFNFLGKHFSELPYEVVYAADNDSYATAIYNNNFEMPESVAIEFLGGAEVNGGAISFNNFSGGSVIQIPCDSKVKLVQNLIRGVVKFSRSGNCVGDFTIGPNYWQTTDKKTILEGKIVDQEKGFNILLPAILKDTPQTKVGRRTY